MHEGIQSILEHLDDDIFGIYEATLFLSLVFGYMDCKTEVDVRSFVCDLFQNRPHPNPCHF